MSAECQLFYSCFCLSDITFVNKTAIRYEKIKTYFFAALQLHFYNTGRGKACRQERFIGQRQGCKQLDLRISANIDSAFWYFS